MHIKRFWLIPNPAKENNFNKPLPESIVYRYFAGIGNSVDGHEETPLDRINERFENFFQDALKTVTRVINFFKRVFK